MRKILLTGGFLRNKFNSLFGQMTIDVLQDINADKAFLSAEGVTVEKESDQYRYQFGFGKKGICKTGR